MTQRNEGLWKEAMRKYLKEGGDKYEYSKVGKIPPYKVSKVSYQSPTPPPVFDHVETLDIPPGFQLDLISAARMWQVRYPGWFCNPEENPDRDYRQIYGRLMERGWFEELLHQDRTYYRLIPEQLWR